ncbi:MAG: HAD-IA family hydrolase [Planctomycetales bacterium]|nr:HAD-IA family hydrolase [Planctomycetales bacterium]NIM10053.1 HAD-IA family hydrolase [Planctomycetales bacterium]NIN09494.1 HAD-IA family hydrolase [Planctomycetales bacterium]NIN77157.1 HAD-IA family hydrolase [Planctomycetales bacterium]NIO34341.1 HAD-IA family hydrolase [Planctomycetales bacterium]
MKFSAIIFDLDGTLLDSLPDIATAANEVLDQQGCPTHSLDAYRYLVGEGVVRLFTKALPPDRVTESLVADCVRRFRESYERTWNVQTRLFQGISELLTELTRRQSALAVLSNKPHTFTQKCVQHYLGSFSFQAVEGVREGMARKPDPAAAKQIALLLNRPVFEFVFVGDTAVDMQTATAAGMYAVGAAWGYREVEELQGAGARTILQQPAQLTDLLDGKIGPLRPTSSVAGLARPRQN